MMSRSGRRTCITMSRDAWEAIELMRRSGVPKDRMMKMLCTNAAELYGYRAQTVRERL